MSRRIGDKLESFVVKAFKSVGIKLRQTANSGAMMDDGDLGTNSLVIECKVKNNAITGITNREYQHLKRQAKRAGKDWMFIVQNKHNDKLVICSLDTFLEETL